MSEQADRRAFPRRPFERAVYTYESGARFEAVPCDISLGGASFRTAAAARLREGDLLSVVLGEATEGGPGVFLIAQVVRRIRGPHPGVGVRWERAVTTGDAAYLAEFLHGIFGVRAQAIKARVEPTRGRFRSLFSFEGLREATAPRRQLSSQGPDEGADVAPTSPREARPERLTLQVRQVEVAEAPALGHLTAALPPSDAKGRPLGPGLVTCEVAGGAVRAAVRLPATLRAERLLLQATVIELGVRDLVVAVEDLSGVVPERLRVLFSVPTQGYAAEVRCDVRLRSISVGAGASRLALAIEAMDEGALPGSLAAFVKWAHHTDMSAAGA